MTVPVQVAVGGVAVRNGEILLIERATDPGRGQWSIPGGRIEPGETLHQAVVREVAEETGLKVTVGPLLGLAERISDRFHIVIVDYLVEVVGDPIPTAGDDAAAAAWIALDEMAQLDLVDGLAGFLTDHGIVS